MISPKKSKVYRDTSNSTSKTNLNVATKTDLKVKEIDLITKEEDLSTLERNRFTVKVLSITTMKRI